MKRLYLTAFTIALIACLSFSCAAATVTVTVTDRNVPAKQNSAVSTAVISYADIISKVMDSVVYVRQKWTDSSGEQYVVDGSGVILTRNGYILTNRHVLENAQSIEVMRQDRTIYVPTGCWYDDMLDLAVIKIEAENLPSLTFADPTKLRVGDIVLAIGHPFGVSPAEGGATVTNGIIGNLGRSFFIGDTPYWDVIQTDAPINPGNSGGPLVNMNGELIGINTAAESGSQGINFAINVASARHTFEDLVAYGQAIHPYCGIKIEDITFALGSTENTGASVKDIDTGSPAGGGDIQSGDVIISFGSRQIYLASDFIRELWRHDAGDTVQMTVLRSNKFFVLNVILDRRPANSSILDSGGYF
jgi:serine protease Do